MGEKLMIEERLDRLEGTIRYELYQPATKDISHAEFSSQCKKVKKFKHKKPKF